MPTGTVDAGADVLVAIPPTGAARFRREAIDEVENAGEQVAEGAAREKADASTTRLAASDLPRLHRAEAVYRQLQPTDDGGLHVTGDPAALLSIVRCCAVDCLEDLGRDIGEQVAAITPAVLRSARVLDAELAVWLDLGDALTAGGAR